PTPTPTETPAGTSATSEDTQQDLEAKLIQLQHELDGLKKTRAAWDDMRHTLDELGPRVDELARRAAEPPSQARTSPLRPPAAPPHALIRTDGTMVFLPEVRLQAGYAGTLVDRGPGQKSAPDTSTFLVQHAELLFER